MNKFFKKVVKYNLNQNARLKPCVFSFVFINKIKFKLFKEMRLTVEFLKHESANFDLECVFLLDLSNKGIQLYMVVCIYSFHTDFKLLKI